MDSQELTRRGPQLMLGSLLVCLGGLIALYGVMYGPVAAQTNGVVTDRARDFAALLAVIATVCGLASVHLYRGSIPMMLVSIAVAAAGIHNVVQLIPYFTN